MGADENARPRGVEIEKKIEYLESLAGNVIFLILFHFYFLFLESTAVCAFVSMVNPGSLVLKSE